MKVQKSFLKLAERAFTYSYKLVSLQINLFMSVLLLNLIVNTLSDSNLLKPVVLHTELFTYIPDC